MKIKKKFLFFFIAFVLLLIGIGYSSYFYWQISKTWEDVNTWSTVSRIQVPQVADSLKVAYSVEDTDLPTQKRFSFSADYCYLYDIEISEDNKSAQMRCSLLPMYYAERELIVPKDWEENPDIYLVIKDSDVEPTQFLGRIDKSFESISSLGSKKLPVRIEFSGIYTFPEKTWQRALEHWRLVRSGKLDEIEVSVREYSVWNVDELPSEKRSELFESWRKEMQEQLSTEIAQHQLLQKQGQAFLDTVLQYMRPQRVKCTNLIGCQSAYEENIGEMYAYMYFLSKKAYPEYFEISHKATYSNLYPFNPTDLEARPELMSTDVEHWSYFSPYDYPICPIQGGKIRRDAEFVTFMKDYLTSEGKQFSTNDILGALRSFMQSEAVIEEYRNNGSWDPDLVTTVSRGCYLAMRGELTQAEEAVVLNAYSKVLSETFGLENILDKESIEKRVFESIAYSPYKSGYLFDKSVHEFREDNIEDSKKSAEYYTEWRSRIQTIIILNIIDDHE